MAADDSGAHAKPRPSVTARLLARRPLVLDGATGTELERRGVRCALPLWSSWGLIEAPEMVRAVHLDYLRAGVDALTAATFRTHARSLGAAGLEARAAELCELAVRLAREAAERGGRDALVLGSAAPLEDCYHPERVPEDDALAREHARHARHLVGAGVDAILVETINSLREGVAAARAARDAGAELLVSFVCDRESRLLSGEPLAEALDAVAGFAPAAVGVNCVPPGAVMPCLPVLQRAGRPFLVYANLGAPGAPLDAPSDTSPAAFASAALRWASAGAACVGGCCGTTPAHLRVLVERLRREHAPTPIAAAQ
jgi:S-methylmethionine-dependent homocysteine/selenocysteine methylase